MPVTALNSRFIEQPLYWAGLVLVIGLALGVSYSWNAARLERHALEMAELRGRLVFNMIQSTRSWMEGHGGSFAPNSPEISSLMQREGELRIHLASLKPLNPANQADDWERGVLLGFETGERERVAVRDGTFHYMGALVVTQTCLLCHAQQGYRMGDIRGGIHVSQPMALVERAVLIQHRINRYAHLAVFVVISGLLLAGLATLRRHVRRLEEERDARMRASESLAAKVAELEATRDELVQSEKMASLGRMVAGFAHEVNTPVGVAVGAVSHALESLDKTEALLSNEEVTEEELRAGIAILREASSLALSNLRRAADMVASFKRTSVDQTSGEARDFDLAQLIDDVFRGMHNTFKRTRIELVAECPKPLWLHGSAGALVQVLTNLIQNSHLHAFDNGRNPGRITVAACMEGEERLRIDYRDDGVGMSSETTTHLFEPFFTTRRGQGGSGLGMYIVYSLATQVLRGSIQCESEPGQGVHCILHCAARKLQAPGETA